MEPIIRLLEPFADADIEAAWKVVNRLHDAAELMGPTDHNWINPYNATKRALARALSHRALHL